MDKRKTKGWTLAGFCFLPSRQRCLHVHVAFCHRGSTQHKNIMYGSMENRKDGNTQVCRFCVQLAKMQRSKPCWGILNIILITLPILFHSGSTLTTCTCMDSIGFHDIHILPIFSTLFPGFLASYKPWHILISYLPGCPTHLFSIIHQQNSSL